MIDRSRIDFKAPVGSFLPDPFFDSFQEELLLTHSIIDLVALCETSSITVTFNTAFLNKLLHSHICQIRKLVSNGNGAKKNQCGKDKTNMGSALRQISFKGR